MRQIIAIALLAASSPVSAQSPAVAPAVPPAAPAPVARPSDVASPEAVVAAVYDVISGGAGVKRDWDRFRSLFFPGAHLIPTGVNRQTGKVRTRMLTPEDFIRASGPVMEKGGFFETGIATRIDRFNDLAHVFTTYETRIAKDDAKPLNRGINSLQLAFDGQRWWILSLAWTDESPDRPLPADYLPRR